MIMFGVEPNDFINFKIDPKQTEEQQLFLRSIQAKNLVEITRPEAMDNIRFKQIKQKQIQDDRNNVLVGDLPTGTLVMLKNEGLLSKLEPLHHGRHIVSGRTSEGNYILENALGQKLKDTYPLKKLRPYVEHEDLSEPHVEIEKILEKRINKDNNHIEYLVKWKNFDD